MNVHMQDERVKEKEKKTCIFSGYSHHSSNGPDLPSLSATTESHPC